MTVGAPRDLSDRVDIIEHMRTMAVSAGQGLDYRGIKIISEITACIGGWRAVVTGGTGARSVSICIMHRFNARLSAV